MTTHSKETDEPAFPVPNYVKTYGTGLTLRDYFAAKALNAVIVATWGKVPAAASTQEERARFAYAMADAMIKERSK